MKKMLIGFMACFLSVQCFAHNLQEFDDKFYVSPGSVYVGPNGIYVNMDGEFIAVEGIMTDATGVYIQDYEFEKRTERKFNCAKCGGYHTLREGCKR